MGGGVMKDAMDEAGIRMDESGKSGAELPFDEQLRGLHKLREDGIITDDEYQEKTKRILENNFCHLQRNSSTLNMLAELRLAILVFTTEWCYVCNRGLRVFAPPTASLNLCVFCVLYG
jgi:hypothetical protein